MELSCHLIVCTVWLVQIWARLIVLALTWCLPGVAVALDKALFACGHMSISELQKGHLGKVRRAKVTRRKAKRGRRRK